MRYTVEGDPTYTRYDFDGERVTIVRDDRRDEFGLGGVSRLRCAELAFGPYLPDGIDCEAAESLPGSQGFADR